MKFNKVEISQFRNLVSATLFPSDSLNLIVGANGSGKSSLLEAIHYMATGSSFRSHRLATIIQKNKECFTLFSEVSNTITHRVGIKRCLDLNHQTRIDGQEIPRRSELFQLLPVQIISPESLSLITDGSETRRNFIDWALFHVEHSYHYHLSHYNRALKQRNALLKSYDLSLIKQWNRQLIEHGEVIDAYRKDYLESIVPTVSRLLSFLFPELDISLSYRSGWAKEMSLYDALDNALDTDQKLKFTSVGPHRGDMILRHRTLKVADTLSRGQLKLVVIALKLAQIIALQEKVDKRPIILVDDIAAELDVAHRRLLIDTLKDLGSQVFISTPDIEIVDVNSWKERKVFHVEHGKIKEMVY